MPSFPNRCQHIKVNGTQCGCPALRRNRFCYFHKRHHEERISLNADRARRTRNLTFALPVLEDANSIQVALMQIMRLLLSGRIDHKTAGLLLYALQTASSNLHRTNFEPYPRSVVVDPNSVSETELEGYLWHEDDFKTAEEMQEEQRARAEQAARRQAQLLAESRARAEAEAERLMAEGRIEREKERQRERREDALLAAERRRLGLDEFPDPLAKPTAPPPKPPASVPATTPTVAANPTATAIATPAPAASPAKAPAPHATAAAPTKTAAPAPSAQPVVTPTGKAILPPTPNRRHPIPTVEEVRKSIRKQVQQAMPEILHALKQKHSPRSG